MQLLLRTLLAIYLGHLLGDFVFQTQTLIEEKRRGRLSAYALHGLTHYLSSIVLVGFFVRGSVLSLRTNLVLAGLSLVHLVIDWSKIHLSRKFSGSALWAYLSDQIVHLATVGIAAWLISSVAPPGSLAIFVENLRDIGNGFLLVPVVYVMVIFGGGYLIRFLTRSLAEDARNDPELKRREQLQNAGLYIGWLERFLVVTALLLQSPAMVGLIFTAKSIARYPEFKSERFAEYFLIGTLLSLSIAILGGVVLTKIVLGHARLAG